MTNFPTDVALAVAAAGVDPNLPDEQLAAALANRGGYADGPTIGEIGWTVEPLAPQQVDLDDRTPELVLAWCLFYLLSKDGEIGIEWSAGER